MPSLTKIQNFINGKFVPPVTNSYLNNVCPINDQVISLVPRSKDQDAQVAVQAASQAFEAWSELSNEDRGMWLLKLADAVEKNCDTLAKLECNDNGQPYSLAFMFMQVAAAHLRHTAGQVMNLVSEARESPTHISYTQKVPLGVCCSITPWNAPFILLICKVGPCVGFGNTIICKPSEMTPSTANYLGKILMDINFPKGVINIVHGYGPEIGTPLIQNRTVQAISFTGGTVTGRKITKQCGELLKRVHCELGGKNPSVVFNDANIKENIETICQAAFMNTGQVCMSGSRIFVQEGIYDKFMPLFINTTKQIYSNTVTMDPLSPECTMGPLVSKQQLQKVEKYMEIARKDGGNFLLGGTRPTQFKNPKCKNGAFYMPTIITGLDYRSRCGQEEIFGPVATVFKFKDTKDLLEMVNSVSYGLYGSVYTQDIQKAYKVARKIQSGTVNINDWFNGDMRNPFGGFKNSGFGGSEGGKHSIELWTQNKCISSKL